MPRQSPLTDLSVTSLAALVASREVTAVEVVQSHLDRIEQTNQQINAVVTVEADRALNEAKQVDRAARDGQVGPLAGVPITVKDIISTAGTRTTWSSRLLAEHVPSQDATAVARLRAAGAIVIGKSNCPEFGLDIQTDNDLFGTTLNPLDLSLTPGGSSGGDSAAVAAGFAAAGIGTDYGGSLRWPAQCTGLVGLRPTAGLVPGDGQQPAPAPFDPPPFSAQGLLQVIGPITRDVTDAALVLDVLGETVNQSAPKNKVSSSEIHIAYTETGAGGPVHPEIRSTVATAAKVLDELGFPIEELDRELLLDAEEIYTRLRHQEGLGVVPVLARGREHLLSAQMRDQVAASNPASVPDYLATVAERQHLLTRVLAQLEVTPILVMPVSALPAFEAGTRTFELEGSPLSSWQVLGPSRAISLLGLPSLSIPFGRDNQGRHLSVQIVGRPFREDEVLHVARALEQVRTPHLPSG